MSSRQSLKRIWASFYGIGFIGFGLVLLLYSDAPFCIVWFFGPCCILIGFWGLRAAVGSDKRIKNWDSGL